MSFGDLFDDDTPYGGAGRRGGGGATMPGGVIALPIPKPTFSSPGLSLGLQTNPQGEMQMNNQLLTGSGGSGFDGEMVPLNNKDDDSRSGSDNADGGSGDDIEQDNNGKKKKKYHRHTPQQIEKLEALFKECPHPDEKQRLELSRALNLESRQVKFWFQNRRTQLKTQIERHENSILRQDNDKLRSENMTIREAMRNPICNNCGGPAMLAEVSLEEQHLRIENARLKDELDRVSSIAGKFLGRPISSMPSPLPYSPLDLAVGSSSGGFAGMSNVAPTIPAVPDFLPPGACVPFGAGMVGSPLRPMMPMLDRPMERSLLVERALMAMDELVKMAQMEEPLWVRIPDGSGKEMLNYEEYLRMFPRCLSLRPVGYVSEISRESGMVNFNSLSLVETLMNSAHFAETFPTMIARTSTTDIISSGMGGTRDNTVQIMYAEMQVLSPLVPIRQVNFVRFCKQHADGVWAVVDVSVDGIRDCPQAQGTNMVTRRLPSGCLVQDMPNGYSKVIWVEHSEYDEAALHPLYRPMIRSGMGLGAHRWVANLQRHFEAMAVLMTTILPAHDPTGMSTGGRQSMLKVAQRMTYNFCAGVCSSSAHKWKPLRVQGSIAEDVRVMTRQSVDDPGEPLGVVLSAATSVWLPLPPDRIFDFLRNEQLRSEWDILSSGVPMHEVIRIAKGHDHGNAVSLLRACAGGDNQTTMLILQESCTDASGSMVVYAPVDIPAMHVVMSGGDSAYVSLLPSGFVIVPDGAPPGSVQNNGGSPPKMIGGGSLLTVGFQILVNSLPTAKLTVESVTTVNSLIIRTVARIKEALLNNIEV